MDWVHLFFGFDGRISRQPFWVASIILLAAGFVSFWVGTQLENERLSDIVDLALLYPDAAVMFKRAHDRETPYWMVTLYLVLSAAMSALSILGLSGTPEDASLLFWLVATPSLFVAVCLLIELGFRKGVSGPNRFGPDPLQGK